MYRIWDDILLKFVQIKTINFLEDSLMGINGKEYSLFDVFLDYKLGKDFYNKPIWSGDVVQIFDTRKKLTWKSVVYWGLNEGATIQVFDKKSKNIQDLLKNRKRYIIKVIGNMYENPHLMTPFFMSHSEN